MSISDTKNAQKYASIAETAAAQAKLYAEKLEGAPDYAAQAEAAAEQASDSAQSALTAQNGANAAAGQASASANEAVQAAADAEGAAEAVFGSSLHAPTGEVLSTLPSAAGRVNTVPVFDGSGDAAVKDIADFAILDSNGKIPVSMIPAVALSEVFVVNSQSAMLALDAQEGDVAKRTDLGYSFILASEPASTLSNWVQVSDDVLAQLGLSTGATEVGAVDDDNNSTTVQGALALKASKAYLSATTGAARVNTSSGATVQALFDQLTGGTFNLKYRNYTVYNRLDEELSVASIAGVDPTGATDSTAALNGFFSLLNTNGTRTTVRIQAGTYLTTGLTINNTSLVIKGAGEYPYGASTTKIKAAAANTTLMTFTRSGCRIEGLLFEGFEAAVNFGATETCTGVKFQPSTGTLADIDSTVHGCTFFCLKNGVVGYGRNLTQRLNGYSHVAFPITLNYVPGQQFRGHVIDDNRFHSCGGFGSATDTSLADSVCIKLVTNTAQGVLADNYAGDISIKNNKCDNGCFQFFLGHFGRGSIMSCNDIFRCGGSLSVMIKIDNTATSSNTDYDNFVLIGNTIASDAASTNPQSFPDYALWMTGVRGGVVSGNAFGKLYKHGLVIENCADIVLNAIQLKNPSMSVAFGGSAYNAVEIISGGNNIQILGLNVRNSQSSTQIQFVINNASATNVMVDNIQANGYTSMINEGSSARTHGIINFGGNRRKEVFATTIGGIPLNINYAVGDICWFTAQPTTGTAYVGAYCVTAGVGTAAVWRNFGAMV
ncbi:glycosyl hydrolase family 28-related protein [Enterobacter cloacae]|uniref:glycosyl hydrolase family 28-related protein n=1 Tax=Enterobacter cloacae TaxID=550 RepID=UPI003F42DFB4